MSMGLEVITTISLALSMFIGWSVYFLLHPRQSKTTDSSADQRRTDVHKTTRNVFPFFKLPRELRDAVYELLACRKDLKSPISRDEEEDTRLRVSVINGPATSLLLVSRQFSSEYSDRCSKSAGLCLEDHDHCAYDLPIIPKQLRNLPLRRVSILFFEVERHFGVSAHLDWMEDIKEDISSSTDIRVYLELPFDHAGDVPDAPDQLEVQMEALQSVPTISQLSIFTWRYSSEDVHHHHYMAAQEADQAVQHSGEWVGGWSRASGWRWNPTESMKSSPDSGSGEIGQD